MSVTIYESRVVLSHFWVKWSKPNQYKLKDKTVSAIVDICLENYFTEIFCTTSGATEVTSSWRYTNLCIIVN